MFKSFILSYKIRNTYRVNSIIYSIKQLPLIGKKLPTSLYANKGLKIFGNIISTILEIINIFLGKAIYILLMIVALLGMYKNVSNANNFINIFLFLSLAGGLLNTYMFNPTKDKYYAMILMNIDAKKYTLSNYYYSMIKLIIGFLPFTLIFGIYYGLSIITCILMPVFTVFIKTIYNSYILYDYNKNKKIKNENVPTKIIWILIAIFVALAYGLPALNIQINENIFYIMFTISLILGIFAFRYIGKFKNYKKAYKSLLTHDNVYMVQKQTTGEVLQNNTLKQIELGKITSNKKGFQYFHDLFVKRHRKILMKSAKKTAIITLLIFLVLILLVKIDTNASKRINELLMTMLPWFVFVMYIINRGTVVTQSMFMNCDHSMLTYRFYKTAKVILVLFKERLKTLIKINLLPAIVISIGLPVLLYLTGGTDNYLNYFILFISIIAMSVFFSVHYLVMYYLLQPYNVNIEMKSSTYSIVQWVTYFICYAFIQVKLPTLYFGIATVAFCILYSIIALILVYKYAPKTFKLRI